VTKKRKGMTEKIGWGKISEFWKKFSYHKYFGILIKYGNTIIGTDWKKVLKDEK